jgi:hypothetical protein
MNVDLTRSVSNCSHVKSNIYDFILKRSKRKKKKKKKPGNSNTTSVNAGLAVGGTSFSAAHLERKRRASDALTKKEVKQENENSDSDDEDNEEDDEEDDEEEDYESSDSDSESEEEEEEEETIETPEDEKKSVDRGEASAPLVVTVKLANLLFAGSERLCKYSLYSVGTCIDLATGNISCAKKASRNNPKKRSSATDMVSQLTRSRKTEANEKRKKFKVKIHALSLVCSHVIHRMSEKRARWKSA